jgi:phosphoglycerate dehydrogenase-like enzyme
LEQAHRSLADLTVGIVGLGSIGLAIAAACGHFGMRVVAVDPVVGQPPANVAALWSPAELERLLAASDFVVIAAPHTPETQGCFGRRQFQAMRPTAVLINIGRGAIVKLDDLTAALQAGELGGAGLDVFETEPLPPEHPLWQMANVIITPHVAGQSPRVRPRHLQVVLDNVAHFVRGEPLRNVVDKRRWF